MATNSPDTRCCSSCCPTRASRALGVCLQPNLCPCHLPKTCECKGTHTLSDDYKTCLDCGRPIKDIPAAVEKHVPEMNYMEVGEWTHCLVCHQDQPRDMIISHWKSHGEELSTKPCVSNCAFSKVPNLYKPQPAPWEASFDELYLVDPGMTMTDVGGNSVAIKSFIAKEIFAAEKRGRDAAVDYIEQRPIEVFIGTGGSKRYVVEDVALEAARVAQ